MALQKKLDYGFCGYELPSIPRATRSSRRRCIFRSKTDDHQLGAFDLLATVADKLLMEGEISPKPVDTNSGKEQQTVVEGSIAEGEKEKYKPLVVKSCDLDVCDQSSLFTEQVSEAPVSNFCSNELTPLPNKECSLPESVVTSEYSRKLADDECKPGMGTITQKLDVQSSGCRVSAGCRLGSESEKQIMESKVYRNLSISSRDDMCSPGCPETWERKQSALVRSPNSIKFPSCRGHMSSDSFPINSGGVKIVNRDNDENSCRRTQPRNANKSIRPLSLSGNWRIRKLLASNHWKATSNLKEEVHNTNKKRCSFPNTKNRYQRQISQRDYPFKKRKFFYCSSAPDSNALVSSDGICSLLENDSKGASLVSGPASPGVKATPTSAAGECSPFLSRNSHVKLKIKSFRVPELFIEIPETATIGSLKRTVVKAVTAVFSDGLRVGMLLQGKKIRDDNRTLLQTGISNDNKSDALGFTLEPNPTQTSPTPCPEDPFQLPSDSPQALAKGPLIANVVQDAVEQKSLDLEQKSLDALLDPAGGNFRNFPESDNGPAPSTPDMSLEKLPTGSQALAVVPEMREALAIVPLPKSKQSESAQRRMRRPFTVSEVEALVQAVEKFGTGRWRDVKLRSFNNVKHRTYVDLKDKWKTLVHTARISPQQRRGEPVPQELLDRVLTAHAYWSEQQTKYQLKPQRESCLV